MLYYFRKNYKRILVGAVVLSSFVTVMINSFFGHTIRENAKRASIDKMQTLLRNDLTKYILKENRYPKTLKLDKVDFEIFYSINPDLQAYVENLLQQHKSDFASIVVLNNNTGEILAASGFERETNSFNLKLVFSSDHPSASLFKIITSANLFEEAGLNKDSLIPYSGRPTTLYKSQLRENNSRWTRFQTLGKAFAVSNNVVFAKAALKNLNSIDLMNKANRFGFNQALMLDLNLGTSKLMEPTDQYGMAEFASGFNVETTIGPIHGAILASIIANKGVLRYPRIIAGIKNSITFETIKLFEKPDRQVLNEKSARELSGLMENTIFEGTARSSFRKMSKGLKESLKIGGKTGSITGGEPFGKRDWFTAFASLRNGQEGSGISVCVMNININKWYIKSTYLAKNVIEYYYQKTNKDHRGLSQQTSKKHKNDGIRGS